MSFYSLSFKWGRIDHGYWFYDAMMEIGKFPMGLFRGFSKLIFQFLFPFVLFGAVPAGILIGKVNANLLYLYVIVACFWLVVANVAWKLGLKSYTSGGG